MLKTRPHAPLPGWVTEQSVCYLAHIEAGRSIRDLARAKDCHPSTILRQIRRLETRRDDPLVDEVLHSLSRFVVNPAPLPGQPGAARAKQEAKPMTIHSSALSDARDDLPSDAEMAREAPRVLRRLCENGAVLALAADMDKAVVVRDVPGGAGARTAVVDRAVARAMALNEWISCQASGRITRYAITQAGRSALNRMMAQEESQRAQQETGFAEAQAPFLRNDAEPGRKSRYALAESPLAALARRKDRDGTRFLSEELVAAGERLREDFELAQIGSAGKQNWDRLLTGGLRGEPRNGAPQMGQNAAQDRVLRALQDLGPGLSDVALRCCCFLEGLETAERRLGWSARSGKIVLRIALQRLRRHYDRLGDGGALMG